MRIEDQRVKAEHQLQRAIAGPTSTTSSSIDRTKGVDLLEVQEGSRIEQATLRTFIASAGSKQILGRNLRNARGDKIGVSLYAAHSSTLGLSAKHRALGALGLQYALRSAQMETEGVVRLLPNLRETRLSNPSFKPTQKLTGDVIAHALPKRGKFIGGVAAWQGAPLEVGKELGRGGFGIVHAAETATGEKLVVKRILHDEYTHPEDLQHSKDEFVKEAEIHRQAGSHPNIISLKAYTVDEQGFTEMLMEKAAGGTLQSLMEKDELPDNLKEGLVRGALAGLAHLQEQNIAHRDFGPHNLLVDKKKDGTLTAKIIDFGSAEVGLVSHEEKAPSAASHWHEPELICAREDYWLDRKVVPKYTNKGDVWGLGVLAYMLYTGDNPMLRGRLAATDQFARMLMRDHPEKNLITYLESQKLGKDVKMPPHVKAFIMDATQFRAKDRPDARALIKRFKPLTSSSI